MRATPSALERLEVVRRGGGFANEVVPAGAESRALWRRQAFSSASRSFAGA